MRPCKPTDWFIARTGYGMKGMLYAHREAWKEANGPIPPGMLVCHSCDNRSCVEPTHLFLGTDKDNQHDSINKGRHSSQREGHLEKMWEGAKKWNRSQENAEQLRAAAKKSSQYPKIADIRKRG